MKAVSQRLHNLAPCYAMDLRCHGESPSCDGAFTYDDMAYDVAHTIRNELKLDKVNLIGHSMVCIYLPLHIYSQFYLG